MKYMILDNNTIHIKSYLYIIIPLLRRFKLYCQ